jgi:Helix-turn-helix domain
MAKTSRNEKRDPAAILALPTISPEQLYAAKLFGVGRNSIYEACNTGEIECFRVGKKIIIPTAPLRRKLGIEAA